jgi:ketosteroid isomerase-like protein
MSQETSTQSTLEHHLQAFGEGIDSIMQDYTEDSVVVIPEATYRGLEEIRTFFTAFVESLPEGIWDAFQMNRQEVVGEVAYILWEAQPWIPLGTDTFVVRDGKIMYQTFAAYAPSE